MARIPRGNSVNVQVDTKLKISSQLELPVKDTFSIDDLAGSIALKSNNNIAYKDNAGVIREIASADLSLYALINSPTFTGIPKAPTAPLGTNTTQLATTAFVLANSGTGSLQAVTTIGNSTDRAIQITGVTSIDTSKNGLALYTPNTSASNLAYIKANTVKSILSLGEIASSFITQNIFGITIKSTTLGQDGIFNINEKSTGLAVGVFNGRVSGSDATNINDFVTLSQLNTKQDTLISGTNIKTINGNSVLGSGDLVITPGITDVVSSNTDISVTGTTTKTLTLNSGRLANQIVKFDGSGNVISGQLLIGGVNGGADDNVYLGSSMQLNDSFDAPTTSKSIRIQLGAGGDMAFKTWTGPGDGTGTWSERLRLLNSNGVFNYSADVSANYTARSIVDKAYVDSLVATGITLTTTGTSGAATLVGTTLNIPVYTSGGGGTNYWSRSGTQLLPVNTGDEIFTSGMITGQTLTSSGALNVATIANISGNINCLGGLRLNLVNKTSAYTINENTDYTIAASGTFNVTLPATVAGQDGKVYVIKNIGVGTITVLPSGSDTIDNASSTALTANQGVIVQKLSATKWIIIGKI